MITKDEAVKIGKMLVQAYNRESTLHKAKYPADREADFAMRGMLVRCIDELWYEVFSNKLKEKYNYNKTEYLNEIWPVS